VCAAIQVGVLFYFSIHNVARCLFYIGVPDGWNLAELTDEKEQYQACRRVAEGMEVQKGQTLCCEAMVNESRRDTPLTSMLDERQLIYKI